MSTVQLARVTDGPGLVAELASHGLRGELVGLERLAVEVADCDHAALGHAIEDWIHARDLPLVPVRLDEHTYSVAPAAG